jgi:ribose-phosphate pyrophosphokinase
MSKWFKSLKLDNWVFVSPDVGNVKRPGLRPTCSAGDLHRRQAAKSGTQTEARHIIGDVKGRNCLIVDDMITTAGTVTEAVKIIKANGALDVYIAATHGVFAGPAIERLAKAEFTRIAVTNTIPILDRCDGIKDRLTVLDVSGLLGEAIHRIHHNESVSALFKGAAKDGAR